MYVMKKAKNEKRLIDANALDERFDKRIEWLRLDAHDKYSLGLYYGAATDKDLIGEMPTVDAVPVIRCRDCIHYFAGACLKIYSDGNVSQDAWQERYEDDFCSYGERKEGTDNG